MSEESPRLRRLRLDNEKIAARFSASTAVAVIEARGFPPESYIIEYNIKGVYADSYGKIHERNRHRLEINLSLGYPRRAPQCKMITPVFHPNFDDSSVCIGDFWAPSEGLDDLIVRIGRMIAYQEYNIKSPLNGLAAKWTDRNSSLLPVDNIEIVPCNAELFQGLDEKIVLTISETNSNETDFDIFLIRNSISDSKADILKPQFPRLDFGYILIQIHGTKCAIGRSLGNTIMLPQKDISAYHAEIVFENDNYTLKDLGSKNGTHVNDIFHNEVTLNHGDRLRFGSIEAQFLLY